MEVGGGGRVAVGGRGRDPVTLGGGGGEGQDEAFFPLGRSLPK
jgi:hypothetical protein